MDSSRVVEHCPGMVYPALRGALRSGFAESTASLIAVASLTMTFLQRLPRCDVIKNAAETPAPGPGERLLAFVYSLLTHDARSALESAGLDACVGFLHRDRPGRPSQALDLIEKFRAYQADRVCLSLINRQQIKASGFANREPQANMRGRERIAPRTGSAD